MSILKPFFFLKGILILATLFCSYPLMAESSPIPMLERSANQIISTLKANKSQLKNNPDIIYKAVEAYLLPHVDVTGMCRSVLGRQVWTKATALEKQQFSNAFTQLVIHTYATPLGQYTDETIQFLPLRAALDKRFIRVNSVVVRSSGQNIPLSYSMVAKDGTWQIYDLSVEGISLLQSFRSQFAQILQNSSIREVIKQMQATRSRKAA